MGAEKLAAFYESWTAMYVQMLRIQLGVATSIMRSVWFARAHDWPSASLPKIDVSLSAFKILGKGMAPVHRRAVANARRLGRTTIR